MIRRARSAAAAAGCALCSPPRRDRSDSPSGAGECTPAPPAGRPRRGARRAPAAGGTCPCRRAQITWCLRKTSCFGKVLHTVIQRLRKCADKRTATGGTGFIDFDSVDYSVVHKDGFHILPSNIQDKRNFFADMFGSSIMSDGFNDSRIHVESRFYQIFSVTGRTSSFYAQGSSSSPAFFM